MQPMMPHFFPFGAQELKKICMTVDGVKIKLGLPFVKLLIPKHLPPPSFRDLLRYDHLTSFAQPEATLKESRPKLDNAS